ncbi:MAG: phosphoenolpyruvate--protein phosphotransferase [Thermodesulfobacteriota bacterium]
MEDRTLALQDGLLEHGIAVSPGMAAGPVLVLDRQKSPVPRLRLEAAARPAEVARFVAAIERVRQELARAKGELEGDYPDYGRVLDSHLLILQDAALYQRTVERIETGGVNAEWALEETLAAVRERFAAIEDRYIRSRIEDVEQVAERVLEALAGSDARPLAAPGQRVILVARDLSPADTFRLRREQVMGFVTEVGGRTSHTAILARALGIPAVVGLEAVTRRVSSGELLILDGIGGRVILRPTDDQVETYLQVQRQYERYGEEVARFAHLAAETRDGMRLKVKANLEMLSEVPSALELGAEGVGLYRSEYFYMGRAQLPDEESLFRLYHDLLTFLAPFPVTIRTLDMGGDKLSRCFNHPPEQNPALGVRAIRFSLYEQEVFRTQLRAMLRASVFGQLRIIFPMISGMREIQLVKEILAEVRAELIRDGQPFAPVVPIGIMVEVPSAVALADVLAGEVDFFSIGTNDLIQYALAIDRANEHVAHMYDPLHPAVLRMIRQVVEAGHQRGIEVGLCGEMAGDPFTCAPLLGLGLDELSMNPLSIPSIKRLIRGSTAEDMVQLAEELLDLSTSDAVRLRLREVLPHRFPEEFGPRPAAWANGRQL